MSYSRKKNVKKCIKRLAAISLFTLSVVLLSFVLLFNSSFAQQDTNESNQKALDSGSQQNYRIIVKLDNATAKKAEAQINEKDMVIQKKYSKNMGDLFSKYKIKNMEPVYKGLVNWKKKTGKTEKEYFNKIRYDFKERSKRSKKDVSLENTDLSNTYVIEADVSSQEEYEKLLESLKKDSRFKYAEADMVMSVNMVPNDPYFSSRGSWNQPYDDLYGVKITSCPEAWDTATGDGITVAVVDTGIDNTHPDISANTWTNTKEIANNGIDDDNNGYIDDTWGWNFGYNNNNPIDDNGHGTHVAGTIAATGNNGSGIVGVAHGAKVMAVKGLNKQGVGEIETLANCIIYAAQNGADVINCSFGGPGYSQALEEAVAKATNLGVVVVVAAGNENDDANKHSPANIPDAITVAATDNQDKRATFSNWGSCIDVAAPGVDVLSLRAAGTTLGTIVSDKYVRCNGTSMATPHVAGVAALILSIHPEFSYDQVSSVIRSSATDIMSTGFDYNSGYGRINAAKALQINSTLNAHIESPVQGSSVIDSVPVIGSANGNNFLSYTLEYGKVTVFTQEPSEWKILEQSNTPVDEGQLGVFDITALSDGKYMIRLSVKDSSNPQNTYFDNVVLEINKTKITSPASLDPSHAAIMKPGKVISIQGSISGQSFQRYRMEWGEGLNPTEWFNTGFTLENGGNNSVTNGLLANWDSSVFPGRAGYYELRLLVDYTGYTDETRTFIYLEPDLASVSWPQKLENSIPTGTTLLPVENAKGQTSLVGITSTTTNETSFVKYSYDGTLQYSASHKYFTVNQAAVGNIDDNPGEEMVYSADGKIRILKDDNSYTEFFLDPKYKFNANYIALQDLDNDAVPEIMVLGTDYDNNVRYLYAFKPDGTLLSSKFPIPIPNIKIRNNELYVHYLVMDINNDGEKEIITQQYNDNYNSLLKLYKWDGTQIDWQAAQPSFPNEYITNMAGGDLDHDGQREIILCTKDKDAFDNRKMYIITSDGSNKNGWPLTLPTKNVNQYDFDLAIADMDRDGVDEIIYSQNDEINVLKMDGKPLSDSWGIKGEYDYGSIVIGDINSDNYPEILANRSIYKEYSIPGYESKSYRQLELVALDKNAEIVKQWGILGTGGAKSYDIEPVLGDFDNNGKVDIAVCTPLLNEENTLVDSALYILTTEGDYSPENMDWPVRLNDPQNTSVHIPKNPMPDVTAITLNTTSSSIRVGQNIPLSANIEPKGANTKVLWSVSNESVTDVAEVTNEGVVFAKHPGIAVIRAASAVNPSKYAECTVTVTEAIDGVLLSEGFESSNIPYGWSVQTVNGDFGKWSTVSKGTNPTVDTPKSGAKMAKFNSNDVTSNIIRLYRTKGISLDNGSYSLDFWMYHDLMGDSGSGISSIQIQVSTDDGSHWVNIGNAINRYDGSSGWKEHMISLDEYSGVSELQIAFLGTGNGGGNIYIDDISVFKSVPVTDIVLDKTYMKLTKYHEEQLTATVQPENATDKEVIWTVQNESASGIVHLKPDGRVIAQKNGTAVIRATSSMYPSKYADCTITVNSNLVTVSGVSLNKGSATLDIGQTEQLTATVSPSDATNKNVIWTVQSTNSAVNVSTSGLITAKHEGTAVVRATSTFDASKYAECVVTVNPGAIVPVTGVSLNTTSANITAGQSEQLTATIAPANATNKAVIWTIQSQSASNVATVSSTGLITANNVGTAVIRATSAADASKYAECVVTVTASEPDTSTLFSEGFEGNGGSIPAGWAVQDVSGTLGDWTFVTSGTSPNPGGPKAGEYMAKFNSLVANRGDSTRLYRTSGLMLRNDGTYALDFWMYHDADNIMTDNIQVQISIDGGSTWTNLGNAVNRYNSSPGWKKHTFSLDSFKGASDMRIGFLATSQFGRFMYLDEIYITGTVADASVTGVGLNTTTATDALVTGVSLNTTSAAITVGQSEQLTATVAPANATNKEVIWTVQSQSSDNVATVSSTGLITANNIGTAVIRVASATDPSKYVECKVTVNPSDESVGG